MRSRGEFAENVIRKDFLPTEIEAIRQAYEPLERAAAKDRQGARADIQKTFSGCWTDRDKVGAFAGISGRTVEKIAQVCAAPEQ
jgi:hypothetical protein